MIIKFCSAQFSDCLKYHELADRLGDQVPAAASVAATWTDSGERSIPVPAFGLFCFGVATAMFALKQLPVPHLEIHGLSLLMIAAALGQIFTGLATLRSNALRAVAFTGFGLFWLSVLAVELLPAAGYGQLPGELPLAGYFAIWGVFSLILAQETDFLTRTCRVVFALLTAFLLLLSLAYFTGSVTLHHSAAMVGFACSLPGLICGVRHGWHEALRLLTPGRAQAQRVR
jgi:succinate-acetate transporter protein